MSKWIPIFKTGTHTDSRGKMKEWTEQDLDNIVEKFDPAVGAPIVIGHPKENAPAYGWVEGVKRIGEMLYYKPMQVIKEFKEMVNKGLFKKRSMSVYPDGALRHIGYLGAQPPAIKGLPDHTFMAEEDSVTYEFEEYRVPAIGRILSKLRDFLIEKYDTNTADKVVSDWEIDDLKRTLSDDNKDAIGAFKEKEDIDMSLKDKLKTLLKSEGVELEDKTFSEGEVKQLIDAAVVKIKDEQEKEFSEKEAKLKTQKDSLTKQAAETQKKVISDFCEGLKGKGVLTPAMDKLGMGITEFMQQISGIETTIDFAESDGKQTPLEFMQSFLSSLPKAIEFGEVAGRDKDTALRGDNAGEKLESLTQQKLKDNKDLGYTQAFAEVQSENSELAAEYAEELRGGE